MSGFPCLVRTAPGAGGLVFAGPAAAGPLSGVRGGPAHSHAGTLSCPRRHARAGGETFPGHLHQARAVLAALPGHIDGGPTGLPSEIEALRWFPLPPACPPSQATRPTSADTNKRSSPQAGSGHSSGPMALGG